ncbi:PLP-dependent transferase [Candidatus Poribacteria bacterium]|nr:PLP-dependent transferase [Candidatus Poribacteria bacterium]
MRKEGISTLAIHAGEGICPTTGSVAPPIYQATTFAFRNAEQGAAIFSEEMEGYVYTRWGNPTLASLERKLAALEGGEEALVTASGMAAVTIALLTVLDSGDHVLCSKGVYTGTYKFLSYSLRRFDVEVDFVDGTNPTLFEKAIHPNTRLIYIETPANPTLDVIDIAVISDIARRHGLPLFIDNTFATPCGQRPLELGADVVIHSMTKYLCGHGDAIGGAIIGRRKFIEEARKVTLRIYGGVLSPFNAWLIMRGIHTLPLRMRAHSQNAMEIAKFLEEHPAVKMVRYPGLPSHPQHEIALKQMKLFGGMISFELMGGEEAGRKLMNSLRLCTLAVSLGDTRTLISHPASMTHAAVPREERLRFGITDGLIRLSVGLEDVGDIIEDLDRGLSYLGESHSP